MEKRIYPLLICFLLKIVTAQKCPSYWYGYSDVSKCYRFMYQNKLSWQDARDLCQIHGGDLLRVQTVNERNWVFNQIQNLRTHAKIPTDNWWVGLNNREYITTWEWADGSPLTKTESSSVINWAPGEPNNQGGNERCGEISNRHFNDEGCSDLNRYVCSRDRSIPLKCDSDHGWQTTNGYCYKVYTARTNWYNAKRRCRHDGGDLVTINSENEEIIMHDFAVNFKQQLWIGLYSVQQPGNQVQWMWTNNSQLSFSYWHGTPHVDRHHLNNSCAVMSNAVSNIQAWTVQPCAQSKAYVCKKPEGITTKMPKKYHHYCSYRVCFPGWIGYQTYCYQFDAQYRLSFNDAAKYCQRQGAELLRYKSDSDRMFINSYLQEMKDSGAQDFWIGASDNNSDSGPYKWRNGQTVTYKYWAAPHNNPANIRGRQDCAFVSTGDRSGKWRTTNNCRAQKPFVCMIAMGRSVRPIPRTPRPHYGCPANWRPNDGQCYRIFDQAVDWLTARSRCQQTTGADLVAIRTASTQNFINHMARTGVQYYIGLNDRTTDGVYVWNDEKTPTTFTSWQPHQPSNSGHQENCVVQVNNRWNDVPCTSKKHFICSKDANSILPSTPPTTPKMDWTVKCGPGWESNPLTNSCYRFIDEPLAWLDALNQCQQFHGNLLTIEKLEEQNYIAGRIQSMNSIGVWIGANDRGTEGGWRWTSGKPFAFLNWAAGQPGAHGQGTDCVVMLTRNAQWDDIDCSQRNGYICEKIVNLPTTRPPRTTTKRIPAGMTLGCRPGWKPYGTSCYIFVRRQTNWMDASVACGHMGAHLASINSRNEQSFIVGNLWKNPKNRYDGVYIGLNDQHSESRFQWSDGTDVLYTNWGTNEPNSFMNHNEDCVEVKLSNGKWNDEVCTTMKGGFVCKTAKSIVSATQNPYQTGCPLYTLGYGAHCYRIVSGAAKNWNDANTFCNRTSHGTLATVNNRYIQAFLSSQLLYRTGYFWLGMSDTVHPGTYTWASGDPILFTYWHNTHTGNERSTCVGMRGDQPIGLWENLDCKSKNNFICQFPRNGGFSTLPTTPTPYPNLPCPSGWTANQGQCYFAFSARNQQLSWMDAVTYCQNLGGDLPSFHNAQNDSVLQSLLSSVTGYRSYWIGLNDRDNEAGYKWSDGSAVDYTNWRSGEPNNFRNNEDCVVYVTATHNWNDANCYSKTSFICAVPRGATLPPSTVVPTPARSAECGTDPNWYFYNNNCYMFNPKSGPYATLSWYDASDYCNGIISNLASIHSTDENNFLMGITQSMSLISAWIGFNELGLNGYSWTDMSPVDFTNWRPNEPNDYFGGERCVEIDSRGGWNDDNCGEKRGYVCKKPVSGKVVIPSPSPYPPGGCANGFTRVPGGRNKCFYLNNNKMNWTAARDQCRRFGKGYDIASIEDLYEQDFFLSMATRKYTNFWIGLNDRVSNNKWLWMDNSPVAFTYWDRGEPTSSHSQAKTKGTENCVAIRMWKGHVGKWADVDCSQSFNSVCQAKQDPNLQVYTIPNSCRKGYKPYQKGCYKISTDVKTWNDSLAVCQGDGGNLTSINNVYESGFVVTLGSKSMPFWIGLSDSKVPGLYGWADGWPVKFTNWGYREPSYDNPGGCVLVNRNGRWNDTDCSRKLHYICKISPVKPPATTLPPPGNCANSKWIPNGDFCYLASVNQGRSWPEANYQCQKNGMQLVSINSKAEMAFVLNLVTQAKVTDPQYKPNIWTGLAKGPQGSFGWTDSSAVNYLNWNSGQPTGIGTHGQLEECVEFDRKTGKWNDLSCFTNRGYVCKTLKVFQTTTLSQTPGPFATGPSQPWGPVVTRQVVPPTQGGSALPPIPWPNGSIAIPGQNSAQTQQQQQQTKETTLGLSGGGIAGVVIGGVVVIVLVALLLVILKTRGVVKPPKLDRSGSGSGLGFDNALYHKGNDAVKIDSDA